MIIMKQDIVQHVTRAVVEQTIDAVRDKLIKIILYGSYARGDFTPESDIDMMILLDCSREELPLYRKRISRIASGLSLESGKEVSLLLQDRETYDEWLDTLVFYQNVEKEGVVLYGDQQKEGAVRYDQPFHGSTGRQRL